MKHFGTIAAALVCAASAHMRMSNPPALMGFENQYGTAPGDTVRFPLMASEGRPFPCQGYHELFNKGDVAATPVAKWATGSQQKFNVMGAPLPTYQASHGGGSCQVSFSTDGGKTFRVVKSFIGDCPALHDQGNQAPNGDAHGTVVNNGFPFTVPKDLPTGPILFAWTWFNHIGNREMYMNCAAIEITGETGEDTIKFEDRPEIFKANIGNGCTTPEQTDLNFPAPGPDVVVAKDAILADPVGGAACGMIDRSATPVTMEVSEIMSAGLTVGAGTTAGGAAQGPVPGTADGNRALDAKPDPAAAAADAEPAVATNAPATSAAPIAAPATPAVAPVTGGNASSGTTGSGVLTGKCDVEGTWNCIDGKMFQQCGSGSWSVAQSMAAGTACVPGTSTTLTYAPAKREVRLSNFHVRRHAHRHLS